MSAALSVDALEAGYEPGLPIVRGASLAVERGEIFAVLGPYGAGKSTLIKAVAGLVPVFAGRVMLMERDITGRAAHRLAHEGLGFVPQTENVFVNLSVEDNLDLAASILRAPKRQRLRELYELFPDLARQRRLQAGRLSGGQRKLLELGRVLMTSPKFILLDEPFAGVNPVMENRLVELIHALLDQGKTFLITDHEMHLIMRLCERVLVGHLAWS